MLQKAIRRNKSVSLICSAIRPLFYSITFLPWPSASSKSVTLGDPTLYRGTTQRTTNCSFLLPTWYLKIEGEHGHYFAKRNEKVKKNKENEGLRIAESTWRVAEGSHFAFCSSVLIPEGKDQVGGNGEQSAHHRDVPRGSTMSPNDPEHDNVKDGARRR
uniref:Uncharacterized protein n=1 Tax=Solanum tuberosum TaxID=4113 RepID=M1DKQ6_SOLTU